VSDCLLTPSQKSPAAPIYGIGPIFLLSKLCHIKREVMIAWVFMLFAGLLLAGILLMPLRIRIDTHAGLYEFCIPGLGSTSLAFLEGEDLLVLNIRFIRWRWTVYPLRKEKARKPEQKPAKEKVRKKRRDRRSLMPHIFSVLKSFQVRHFRLEMDTTDPVWNAWLFPLAVWLSGPGRRISINYQRRNVLQLEIRNRIVRIAYAWVRPYMNL
jgi:hypothetical protein